MSTRNWSLGALILCAGAAAGQNGTSIPATFAVNPSMPPRIGTGADVIVGDIPDTWRATSTASLDARTINAYAIGTTSCNIGTVPLDWYNTTSSVSGDWPIRNRHPAIGMNVFRHKTVNGAGRFEQIGASWLKHGFTALQEGVCGSCAANPDGRRLGVGCSDPYTASLNSSQGRLGPRYQVNPTTGFFTYPVTNIPSANGTYGRRIVLFNDDIDPTLNTGALYYGEGHYVTRDDQAAGNGLNNASYRRLTFTNAGAGLFNMAVTSTTKRQQAGIMAWREADPTATIVTADLYDTPGSPQNRQRFILGYKVTQIDANTWDYFYAVHNLNAEVAGRWFAVPNDPCGTTAAVYHSRPRYHSGEVYENAAAWTDAQSGQWKVWGNAGAWNSSWTAPETISSTPTPSNGNQAWNDNRALDTRNALRWGTMYSFGFRSNRAPVAGEVRLGLYKVAGDQYVSIPAQVPGFTYCASDLNSDCLTDFNDYLEFLNYYNTNDMRADFNGDGVVDFNDYLEFLNVYNACL